MLKLKVAAARASSNIALIKYWGKRNEDLILPLNSSISMTLGEELSVYTKVEVGEEINDIKIVINGEMLGEEETMEYGARVLEQFNKIAGRKLGMRAFSYSFFPTSSGLASSAAGIAALTLALNEALNTKLDKRELSKIARSASGSACRSLFGGFVMWSKGERNDGEDSYCFKIEDPWEEIIDVILIVSEKKKEISSRKAMKITSETSWLLDCRLKRCEEDVKEMERIIKGKKIKELFYLIARHSNNMHSVMLDSFPPIFYLNDVSIQIIKLIHEYGIEKATYSFDAGSNANVITLKKYKEEVLNMLRPLIDQGKVKDLILTKMGKDAEVVEIDEFERIIKEKRKGL